MRSPRTRNGPDSTCRRGTISTISGSPWRVPSPRARGNTSHRQLRSERRLGHPHVRGDHCPDHELDLGALGTALAYTGRISPDWPARRPFPGGQGLLDDLGLLSARRAEFNNFIDPIISGTSVVPLSLSGERHRLDTWLLPFDGRPTAGHRYTVIHTNQHSRLRHPLFCFVVIFFL